MNMQLDMNRREPGIPHPRLPLPPPGQRDDPQAFLAWLKAAIPAIEHLGVRTLEWQGSQLVAELTLAPNLNDKGTGFGGAFASQAILLGWCWATLWLRERGIARDIVVAESSQRFQAPVLADYRLSCGPESEQGPDSLAQRLESHGRGRITLSQQLWCADTLCLEASGNYAVLPAA